LHPVEVETGTGPAEQVPNSYKVKSFVEKPDRNHAKNYLQSQCYLWNAGIFCFTPKAYLEALQAHTPDVYEAVVKCWGQTRKDDTPVKLDPKSFAAAPEVSIDYAVMEHADNVGVVACDFTWSD